MDSKKESERTIEFITKRDELAKIAEEKASKIRKTQYEKMDILGEIGILESKKKAIVDIHKAAEHRCIELHKQFMNDRKSEEKKIKDKIYTSVELENSKPTQAALLRRGQQILASNKALYKKFIENTDIIKETVVAQENSLISEIRSEQKKLEKIRTVTSMGEELKVAYGSFSTKNKGWEIFISFYSEGVLLYNGIFILSYEALVGKKAPDIATELNDTVIKEYSENVEMYNSLFARGTPLLSFELDYMVKSENDDKPSEYIFEFKEIRVNNITNGKILQTAIPYRNVKRAYDDIVTLDNAIRRKFEPQYDLRIFSNTKGTGNVRIEFYDKYEIDMIQIPGKNYEILATEVTQKLFSTVMGKNPSMIREDNYPVENVNLYDIFDFCNKLSIIFNLTPVYTIDRSSDITKYHRDKAIVYVSEKANGFRLPTEAEWIYAAKGGEEYKFTGSNNLDEVAWYANNSGKTIHSVGEKKSNGYGLYDMMGNVYECLHKKEGKYIKTSKWHSVYVREDIPYYIGGDCNSKIDDCKFETNGKTLNKTCFTGFRIARTISE